MNAKGKKQAKQVEQDNQVEQANQVEQVKKNKRISTDVLLNKKSTENEKIAGVLRKSIIPMVEIFKRNKQTTNNAVAKTVIEILKLEKTDVKGLELAKKSWVLICDYENKVKDYSKRTKAEIEVIKEFFDYCIIELGKTSQKKTFYETDLFD